MNVAGLSVTHWAGILAGSDDREREVALLSLSDELGRWGDWLRAEAARLRPSRDISAVSGVRDWERPMWCRRSFLAYWTGQKEIPWRALAARECEASWLPEPLFLALRPSFKRHETLCDYHDARQAWADLLKVLHNAPG